MRPFFTNILTMLLAASVHAAPVHIALKSSAAVQPDAAGFFLLGAVADLSGGDKALRTRMADVSVGRAPLPGETRNIDSGDLALKLRQAGFHPSQDVVFDGAAQSVITDVLSTVSAAPVPSSSKLGGPAGGTPAPAASLLIRRGAAVTIVIQDDVMTITAPGVAREDGAAGDTIRVHRDGVMTDLIATVVDAQTVRMED